jgi:hypothetical protein
MMPSAFAGYPELSSNTTYTPNQFFDVVLPHSSRGVVRLVAYMLRKTLGWSDAQGNPQEPQVRVSWRELVERAGISRSEIGRALEEAIARRYLRCVERGRSHSAGTVASSALYELCWDEREEYVTDPESFQGFFSGNGNLTYIPNAFFDHTIPTEPLSVIRVVGAIIRHTIGFQTKFGFRRQHVEMSFTELQRRTNIVSRRSLSEAIQQALHHNHLVRVQEGVFDRQAGRESRPTTYGIKWADVRTSEQQELRVQVGGGTVVGFPLKPYPARTASGTVRDSAGTDESSSEPSVRKGYRGIGSKRIPDRFEKDTGGSARKGYRERSEKDTGDRFEKDTGLEITPVNNTSKEQQQQICSPESHAAVAALVRVEKETEGEAYQLLTTEGFTPDVARLLVASYPEERIRRQCQWIQWRSAQRNRLGLLRKSIEEDWPEPQGTLAPAGRDQAGVRTSEQTPSATFAAYAYAGFADNPGLPVSTASATDVRAAEPFVVRLLELWPEETRIPEWGRQFGAYVRRCVRTSEQSTSGGRGVPLPKSVAAWLRAYGDEFYLNLMERRRQGERQALAAAKKAHQERFSQAFQEYLREQEKELRENYPDLYTRFLEDEEEARGRFERMLPAGSKFRGEALRTFDEESEHLERLTAFLRGQDGAPVVDFWTWDAELNPERFERPLV